MKISALKIESFQNFAKIFENFVKNYYFKILTKMKVLERIVYVISPPGGGARESLREKAKYCRKFHQNFVQNFTKIAIYSLDGPHASIFNKDVECVVIIQKS